jgi:hypothetical protein
MSNAAAGFLVLLMGAMILVALVSVIFRFLGWVWYYPISFMLIIGVLFLLLLT